jgi:hypothetical protein
MFGITSKVRLRSMLSTKPRNSSKLGGVAPHIVPNEPVSGEFLHSSREFRAVLSEGFQNELNNVESNT